MRANKRTDERVAQYFSLYSWLFWTIVCWRTSSPLKMQWCDRRWLSPQGREKLPTQSQHQCLIPMARRQGISLSPFRKRWRKWRQRLNLTSGLAITKTITWPAIWDMFCLYHDSMSDVPVISFAQALKAPFLVISRYIRYFSAASGILAPLPVF